MLSVVIPCFNERGNVERFARELFPALSALGGPFEVIAVDDGSTDGTREALQRLGPPVQVAAHRRNRGLGAALRTGFDLAQGDWIATLDADLTFAPSQLSDLIRVQREAGADLVSGSPFLAREGLAEVPWRRRLPSLMVNAFYRGLLRHDFTSYTPMLRLYRASRLKALDLRAEGFEINAEIVARFLQRGWDAAEIPAVLSERRASASKLIGWRELGRHARLIVRLLASPAK